MKDAGVRHVKNERRFVMGDDAIQPAARRSGCFRWTCGCIVIAAALPLLAAVACWWAISGWTPAGSAWEHLPPDAIFAFEANDVGGLLKTAGGDPGAVSLAAAVLRRYQRFLEEHRIPVEPDLAQTVYDWNESLAWLYTTFFPNYMLIASRSFAPDDTFLIVQPPRWFAWTAGAAVKEGEVQEIADDEGNRVFIAFHGEFVVAALNAAIVRHVLDNWPARTAPLGNTAGTDGPYCMIAYRSGPGESARVGEGTGDAPFLSGGLANNFVAPRDPFAPPAAAPAGSRFQALVRAGSAGWNIHFETADAAMPLPPESFAEHMDAAFDAETPDAILPDASDVELALKVPEEYVEKLAEMTGDDWLRHGWLERAGGTFTLLAARPAVEKETEAAALPYPPLPVVSLGWTLRSLHAPTPFANFLEESLEKLRARSPLPEKASRALLHSEAAPDKLSGALTVPEVLVNGAKPVWKFFVETIPPTGWMATDPAGLPDESLLNRLAVRKLPEPAAGRAAAAANWDMSRVFIDAAAEVAVDRLSQIPDGREDFEQLVQFARTLFTVYPRGTLRADINMEARAAQGRAFVPFGVGLSF